MCAGMPVVVRVMLMGYVRWITNCNAIVCGSVARDYEPRVMDFGKNEGRLFGS